MSIQSELKQMLEANSASLVGFASIKQIENESRENYEYALSIGIALDKNIVRNIYPGPNREYYDEYKRKNQYLNILAEKAANILIENGYEAMANTQTKVIVDSKTKRSKLPHKTIATLSGLGWIGKSNLMINEKYGSAIRLTSVLTNAKFGIEKPRKQFGCGECRKCVEICPAKAIHGVSWRKDIDRDEIVDVYKCKEKMVKRGEEIGIEEATCGLCIWICPYTQKYLK